MKKPYYKSKTFWGALLISLEVGLRFYNGEVTQPVLEGLIVTFGTFLTVFGFRDAVGK